MIRKIIPSNRVNRPNPLDILNRGYAGSFLQPTKKILRCVKPFTHYRAGMGVGVSGFNITALAIMDAFADPHLMLALYSVRIALP